MKVLIVYYSMYGHIYKMAEAAAEGVRTVEGAEAVLRRVPETLPPDVLEKMGAVATPDLQEQIPVCTVEELGEAMPLSSALPPGLAICAGKCASFSTVPGSCG